MALSPGALLQAAADGSGGPACVDPGRFLLPGPGLLQVTESCSVRLRPWSAAGGPPAFSLVDDWMSLSLGKIYHFTFLLACLGRLCAYKHVYMCVGLSTCFSSLGSIPRSGIGESYGSSVLNF